MSRLATTLTACALLAIFAFTASTAEDLDVDPFGDASTELITYELQDLLDKYVQESGRSILFTPASVRHQLTVRAPKGSDHSAETLLRHALAQFRLALVAEGDFEVVMPLVEARRRALHLALDSEELATVHPMTYVSVVVPLRHADPNTLYPVVREAVAAAGSGLALPVDGGIRAVLISDYAYRVPRLLRIVAELDKPRPFDAATVKLTHGDVTEIMDALTTTFAMEGLNAAQIGSADSVVVSGPPEVVRQAVQLVNELDAAAAPSE
jgi:type II secretory pathway component GspD/PulD (secretin)